MASQSATAEENAPAVNSRAVITRRRGRRMLRSLVRVVLLLTSIIVILRLTGCMEHLFYHPSPGPTPVPIGLPGAEAVWFNSADGTRLHGWFISATEAESREPTAARPFAPTILHAHGNAGNIESHIWFTEYLPEAGFNVFIFDYRGYGQSEGAARTRGPLIADTHAALDYLLSRAGVDVTKIGLYGQSLGGAIGLNVMADRPEIRAAVIESSFASWRDMAACALGGDQPGAVSRTLAAMLISDANRADEAIARIDRPVLLLHGATDSIIPCDHSRRLKEAAGGRARLVELSGGDHNTLRETNPEVDQIVIDFFFEHLRE